MDELVRSIDAMSRLVGMHTHLVFRMLLPLQVLHPLPPTNGLPSST